MRAATGRRGLMSLAGYPVHSLLYNLLLLLLYSRVNTEGKLISGKYGKFGSH